MNVAEALEELVASTNEFAEALGHPPARQRAERCACRYVQSIVSFSGEKIYGFCAVCGAKREVRWSWKANGWMMKKKSHWKRVT